MEEVKKSFDNLWNKAKCYNLDKDYYHAIEYYQKALLIIKAQKEKIQ